MSVLTTEVQGHIGWIWLANEKKRNAMGAEFWDAMPGLVAEMEANEEVRVIVVAAKGSEFCVGLDLKGGMGPETAQLIQGGLAAERLMLRRKIKEMQRSISALAECPKPVIAAVHGWCIGGGLDLISGCDIRLASADAQFSLRETRIAIVADVGSLQRLPGILPRGVLSELAFTGRDFSAEYAERIGLLNAVHPDRESLLAAAQTLAEEIARNSPLAVQGAKTILRYSEGRRPEDGLDYVALWNSAFLASGDLMEALMSFMEKREPKFQGR